ncbi:hypothetical protein TNCT_16691 [Trichonephila clavata]|uniref:Uncharacterized protein n=1 Tax=Trichonephila clavata TaxID=2740835 RepID=A0A8X6EWR3_TRICU|nr:hypothetical protein TNCT_16691 [Trichonephila clavata]
MYRYSALAQQSLPYERKRVLQRSGTSSVEFSSPTPSAMVKDGQQELQGQTRTTEGPLSNSTQGTPSASYTGGCYVKLTCSGLNILMIPRFSSSP